MDFYIYSIYVWWDGESWVAKSCWTNSKDGSDIRIKGEFGQYRSGQGLSEAIDEVVEIGVKLGLQQRDKVNLYYYSTYEVPDKDSPLPAPPANYTSLIRLEADKRGWTSYSNIENHKSSEEVKRT